MKKIKFINNTLLFVAVLLACFAVSVGVRYQQFEIWKQTPSTYFVGERPMMSTLDAPLWLRFAREFNEGVYGQSGRLRGYPQSTDKYKKNFTNKLSVPLKYTDSLHNYSPFFLSNTSGTKGTSFRDVPLISFLIANLVPFFNYNYYLTGTLMIPVMASLFVLPLGIYFFMIGIPLSGLLGGLIGTFASGYYMRSSIGRIDTDMLNLFFPVLAALFIMMASRAKTDRYIFLYALISGLSLYLFQWWYNKSVFVLSFYIVFIISMFLQKIRFRTILLSSLMFLICVPINLITGSSSAIEQLSRYYSIQEGVSISDSLKDSEALSVVRINETTPAIFPNTMSTISEVNHVPMEQVFRRVLTNTTLDWIGFLGLIGMAVFKWRLLLPLAPMLALGLFSFQSSNRFIMYLAPFIGIGLGWLLQLGVEGVFLLITKNIDHRDVDDKDVKGRRLKTKGSVLAKIITWLSMDSYANGRAPKGTNNPETNQQIAAREGAKNIYYRDTEDTVIYWCTWVRQGSLYLGLGVFFWLISGQTAISFVPGPSIHPRLYATFHEVKKRVPEDSVLLTWWDYGYAITDATELATFHDGGDQFSPRTYFIARSMISSDPDELYDITQYLATEGNRGIAENNTSPEALMNAVRNPQLKPWDPIYLFFTADMTGKYGAISKLGSWDIVNGGSKPRGYQNLACNKITNEEMNCSGAKIDLKAGKINNNVALKRVVFIRDGQVMREQKFRHTQGYTLQMLVSGNQIVEVQLIDEVVFRSNYNQMFLLGRYRKDLYEETYNAFPFSRLFKVKYQ